MKIAMHLFFLCFIFLTGCVEFDYVGQKLAPRDESEYITIYPSMDEVPAEFRILGRGKIITPQSYDMDDLDALLTSKAQDVGADAVAISSQKRVVINVSDNIQTSSSRPAGSWHVDSTTISGDFIYTDSFGKQQQLQTVRTERYRNYYQVVFLTKKDLTKKQDASQTNIPLTSSKKDDAQKNAASEK